MGVAGWLSAKLQGPSKCPQWAVSQQILLLFPSWMFHQLLVPGQTTSIDYYSIIRLETPQVRPHCWFWVSIDSVISVILTCDIADAVAGETSSSLFLQDPGLVLPPDPPDQLVLAHQRWKSWGQSHSRYVCLKCSQTISLVVNASLTVLTDALLRHKLWSSYCILPIQGVWIQEWGFTIEKFIQTHTVTVELCSHSVEKTKQCHTDSSVFQSGDLMRKKNIQLKVSFRKGGGAVTLSDAASFLSAILNEGAELSFTSRLSQVLLQLCGMHTHQKRCTHA